MSIELMLMSVSALGMLVLLGHKKMELSRGTSSKFVGMRQKTDPILRNVHKSTGKYASYVTFHNSILFANFLFVQIVRFCMHAFHKAHKVSENIVTRASKKTEDLSRGGAASFYLKKIKEGKDGAGTPETKR